MSDRYLPFSNDDLERDMQDRQSCRVCGRACSSTVGLCRSAVCTSALVEQLEAENAKLELKLAWLWEAAQELVVNAEFDGDISTVDTGDLKTLQAALQEKGE